jgi:hypothetical protein
MNGNISESWSVASFGNNHVSLSVLLLESRLIIHVFFNFYVFSYTFARYDILQEINFMLSSLVQNPRVVTGEKNSPTVAHACRKRRLKWVLPRLGVGAQG